MRRKTLFSGVGGIVFVCLILFVLQWKFETPAILTGALKKVDLIQKTEHLSPDTGDVIATDLSFSQRLETESRALGRLSENPAQIEAQLNTWAENLSDEDFKVLEEDLSSAKLSGDATALGLDLLGRSDSPRAGEALLHYLSLRDQKSPERETFRALAMEGLIDRSRRSQSAGELKKALADEPDAFLAKRAAQALQATQGKAPWPEDTDQKGLRELLDQN